ncbi:MAG: hypothetical protein ACI8UO_004057 [Verrucomicrobiales bacterium]|jgi:hypothetical protein
MSVDRHPKILCLWSGPRNVSTALMYSFAERSDAAVVDEPLYGHYLRLTHAPQPHWEELLEILETDGEKTVCEVILNPPAQKPIFFIKNMAHHLIELDETFLDRMTNIILIRDPEQMLPSLVNQIAEPTPRDAALEQQADLFRKLTKRGQNPIVLDSKQLLMNPEKILRQLCERAAVEFDPSMLSWEPGPRAEDGPWAKWWYHNLHKSTGFQPFREKPEPFPDRLRPLLDSCRPHYEFLTKHALQA